MNRTALTRASRRCARPLTGSMASEARTGRNPVAKTAPARKSLDSGRSDRRRGPTDRAAYLRRLADDMEALRARATGTPIHPDLDGLSRALLDRLRTEMVMLEATTAARRERVDADPTALRQLYEIGERYHAAMGTLREAHAAVHTSHEAMMNSPEAGARSLQLWRRAGRLVLDASDQMEAAANMLAPLPMMGNVSSAALWFANAITRYLAIVMDAPHVAVELLDRAFQGLSFSLQEAGVALALGAQPWSAAAMAGSGAGWERVKWATAWCARKGMPFLEPFTDPAIGVAAGKSAGAAKKHYNRRRE